MVNIMKEWLCLKVNHHEEVAETVDAQQLLGWILHTYTTAYFAGAIRPEVNHYLLFYHEV